MSNMDTPLADALAALSKEYLGDGVDPEKRERYLDTISLVLMRMLPTVDRELVDSDMREMFQIAMARTGVNELVRSPADFDRVVAAFEELHPPDQVLVTRIREAIEGRTS